MKMQHIKSILIVVILLLSVSFISMTEKIKQDETIKIGFSFGDAQQERWKKDSTYFTDVITGMGGMVYCRFAKNGHADQVKHCNELLDLGINVLVIVAANGDSASIIVENAHKKGIKVIAYDRLINKCDLDYYISYNSEKVGEFQANYATNLKPSGKYMIINGPDSDNNSLLIKKGQMNILSSFLKEGKIEIIYDEKVSSWSREQAYNITKEYFTKSNIDPDVVLVANDDLAMGVINVLKERNIEGKVLVTGQDADIESCKEIVKGNQTMTVYKPIKPLAYTAATTALAIIQKLPINDAIETIYNGKTMVPSIILAPFTVDKLNIKVNIVNDGHISLKDLE